MAASSFPGNGKVLSDIDPRQIPRKEALVMDEDQLYEKIVQMMESTEEFFLADDKEAIDVILSNNGCIFGGYLRDTFRGVIPNDIDAVVSDMYKDKFQNDMVALQYIPKFDQDNETWVYSKMGHRDVEIIYSEDDPDEVILGPAAAPDFDCNLLSYCRKDGLTSWTGEGKVENILENILKKECVQITPDIEMGGDERKRKILSKGFTIK